MVAVAICILISEPGFLCQLRDDVPGIRCPGQWGLFGGHIEEGEDARTAVERELMEEICLDAKSFEYLGEFPDEGVIRHVFVHTVETLSGLILKEGWDMAVLTREQIESGFAFSEKAGIIRPVADPVRAIFRQFFQTRSQKTG